MRWWNQNEGRVSVKVERRVVVKKALFGSLDTLFSLLSYTGRSCHPTSTTWSKLVNKKF